MKEPRDIRERTFDFAASIVRFCWDQESSSPTTQFLLAELLRHSTEVGAWVEDAHGHQGKADFVQKMSDATKAAKHTTYWLRLLKQTQAVPDLEIDGLQDESQQITAILTTIVKRSKENGA